MKISIVIGMCYGDEGKGAMVNHLATPNSLVVRHGSGQQAGHTVVVNGKKHVFSNFGSGTLKGADTYWSQFCTFEPVGWVRERDELRELGVKSNFYIHPLAMVTTPFDIAYNHNVESVQRHGSVGLGFGATIGRNETPFKLYAIDLMNKHLCIHKLRQIAHYYEWDPLDPQIDKWIEEFMDYVAQVGPLGYYTFPEIAQHYSDFIFEGAQGIMLDMDHGYFPHVTRSNTTSKNAHALIKEAGLLENALPSWPRLSPTIYYMMRTYLTRHGNGPMPNQVDLGFKDETNKPGDWQGAMRQGFHSMEQLQYALAVDDVYSYGCKKTLCISHLDQTKDKILVDNQALTLDGFLGNLQWNGDVYTCSSEEGIYTEREKQTV